MSWPVVYYGSVINPRTLSTHQVLPKALIAINAAGTIDWIVESIDRPDLPDFLKFKHLSEENIIELKNGEFIIPGFIDTHTHAPQVPNVGSGQQYELLDWLDNVTFPMEAKFSDPKYATAMYPSVVKRFIDCGTTTCSYFGSIHSEATNILADAVKKLGQRAFVGKCNMNRNAPDCLCEASPQDAIQAALKVVDYIRSLKSDLVHPILTPRFAITCTGELLEELGDLLKKDKKLAIQTHVCENKAEIAFTLELFPDCKTYAGVYEKTGLLTERSILAHAVHLEEEELALIKKYKSGISHCPTSNFNLRSGMANVGRMLDQGIKVSLGTDVSGGFSPSIITAIQHASICSKMVALQSTITPTATGFEGRQLPISTLLYLATMGGAEVCNLSDKIGNFEKRKEFDALIVSVRPEAGNPSVWNTPDEFEGDVTEKQLEAFLERFLFCGDDRNIRKVFVQGKLIGGKEF